MFKNFTYFHLMTFFWFLTGVVILFSSPDITPVKTICMMSAFIIGHMYLIAQNVIERINK